MVELLAALSAASSDESCRSSADDPAKEASRLSSLGPIIAEIERAFEEISRLAFKRQMPLPVITVQSKGRSSSIGWFWQEKWQNDQPKRLPEINLCPEYLGRSVEDIAEVLIHEMSHYANYLDGIRDCSSSQYHNRHFKRRCDLVGLVVSRKMVRFGVREATLWSDKKLVGRGGIIQSEPTAFAPCLLKSGTPISTKNLYEI